MTVVVLRYHVTERRVVGETFAQRNRLRQRHKCLSARLLADEQNSDSLLVLWEFPTREDAQAYITESMFHYGGANIADMKDRVIGYYDEIASWPKVISKAS
ncbi:MAG: hypothetical protein E6G36_08005 [Actinobacteria bacterium]|nr:MAG: hypothetical protein E6G36_08005 [Actinomycetota bacterium]